MAVKSSVAAANAALTAWYNAIGASAILRGYTGSAPANCAAAATGTLVMEITLPSAWMGSPSGGVITKSGDWVDADTPAGGTIGYYRIYDSAGTTCHDQGTCGLAGSGADMIFEEVTWSINDRAEVSSYARSIAT